MAAALIQAYVQLEDANGAIYSGAKAYTYTVGTTTPLTTYSDYALTTPHANPVVADSAGVFAPIYANTAANVKVVLKTSADVTLRTIEEVPVTAAVGSLTVDTAQLVNDAATNAKLTNMAAKTLKGRPNTGTGDPEDIAWATIIESLLDEIGTTRGALLTPNATTWALLAPGTAGHMLNSAGSGADLLWGNNGIRAHCKFSGTGTPAFAGTPYNVTSITDNGTGNYTLNFTTALPSANYTPLCSCNVSSGNSTTIINIGGTVSASSCQLSVAAYNSGSSTTLSADPDVIGFAAIGG